MYLVIENTLAIVLVPLICFIAMATHTAFVSLVFPMVFSVLMCRAFINNENHIARNIIILILSLLTVAGSFLYFTFYNPLSVQHNLDYMISNIAERSNGFFPIDTYQLAYVYLDKNHEHFKVYKQLNSPNSYHTLSRYIVMMIPSLFTYIVA